jgi:gas vesicle protein
MYAEHMQSSNGSHHSFTVGLVCGAAIGAAVGLLLAPRSGAELRSDLAGQANRLRRSMNDRYNQASGMVDRVVEDGREAMRRGREAFERTREDFAADAEERSPHQQI